MQLEAVPRTRSAELAALAREIFTESYQPDDDPEGFAEYVRTAFSDETVGDEMGAHGVHYAWALHGDRPVAFLKVDDQQPPARLAGYVAPQEIRSSLHVHRLYVRSSERGGGLGAAMVNYAADIARSRDHDSLWLCVWEKNEAAISFYRHLSFDEIGDHPFQIGKELHRDLVMLLRI